MKIKKILALLAICTLFSCGESKQPETPFIQSFELSYSSDTVNVIDRYGRKQGVWLNTLSNYTANMVTVPDTLVYLNDTAYSTKGTTARELIWSLNEKRR